MKAIMTMVAILAATGAAWGQGANPVQTSPPPVPPAIVMPTGDMVILLSHVVIHTDDTLPPGSYVPAFSPGRNMVVPSGTVIDGSPCSTQLTLRQGDTYTLGPLTTDLAIPSGSALEKGSMVPRRYIPPVIIGSVGYQPTDAAEARHVAEGFHTYEKKLEDLERTLRSYVDHKTTATVNEALGTYDAQVVQPRFQQTDARLRKLDADIKQGLADLAALKKKRQQRPATVVVQSTTPVYFDPDCPACRLGNCPR